MSRIDKRIQRATEAAEDTLRKGPAIVKLVGDCYLFLGKLHPIAEFEEKMKKAGYTVLIVDNIPA